MECVHWDVTGISSRPLLGVLISLLDLDNYGTLYVGSRPLLGVLISLHINVTC